MSQYPFEKNAYKKIQLDYPSNLAILNKRLNIDQAKDLGSCNIAFKIKSLLNVYNGNIEWYMKAVENNKLKLNLFFWLSIGLLIAIPFILFCFTHVASSVTFCNSENNNLGSFENISSQVLAILTSLLGLHGTINGWLGKRKLLSLFHEAASELKANFYAFEDDWNSKPIFQVGANDVNLGFDEAIEIAITQGRTIANRERQKYFEAIENPQIDLSSILTNSFTKASGLFKNFQSKRFERMMTENEERVKTQAELKTLENELRLLTEWLSEVESGLIAAPADSNLTSRKTLLLTQIDAIKAAIIKKKSQLK